MAQRSRPELHLPTVLVAGLEDFEVGSPGSICSVEGAFVVFLLDPVAFTELSARQTRLVCEHVHAM